MGHAPGPLPPLQISVILMSMYRDIIIDGNLSHAEAFEKLTDGPVGYSVSRAARILEMSRQAVDKAIIKGALQATRIYLVTSSGKKLVSTEVDRESVHSYAQAKHGRNRVPFGYRDDQLSIFS